MNRRAFLLGTVAAAAAPALPAVAEPAGRIFMGLDVGSTPPGAAFTITGPPIGSPAWCTVSPEQILRDINDLFERMQVDQYRGPDVLLIPARNFAYLG